MFDQLTSASSDIFDANTGNSIGKVQFMPTYEAEHEILDYLNYGIVPKSLVLLDVNINNPSACYSTPVPFTKNHRIAILYASVRDKDSGTQLPFIMRLKYDTVARGNLSGDSYHADSVELSNIRPIDIQWVHQ